MPYTNEHAEHHGNSDHELATDCLLARVMLRELHGLTEADLPDWLWAGFSGNHKYL